MPSKRATTIADIGPVVVLLGSVVALVPLAVLRFWLLPPEPLAVVLLGFLLVFAASYAVQGCFLLAYPATAVEERIHPPMTGPSVVLRELVVPSSPLGARLVGLLDLCIAGFGTAIVVVLARSLV